MREEIVKIVVYVPEENAEEVRTALANAGAGHIGNYDRCSFTVKGKGRFRALEGADPFIGKIGRIQEADEVRIETVGYKKDLEEVLKALKEAHPYEEPAVDIFPTLNHKYP